MDCGGCIIYSVELKRHARLLDAITTSRYTHTLTHTHLQRERFSRDVVETEKGTKMSTYPLHTTAGSLFLFLSFIPLSVLPCSLPPQSYPSSAVLPSFLPHFHTFPTIHSHTHPLSHLCLLPPLTQCLHLHSLILFLPFLPFLLFLIHSSSLYPIYPFLFAFFLPFYFPFLLPASASSLALLFSPCTTTFLFPQSVCSFLIFSSLPPLFTIVVFFLLPQHINLPSLFYIQVLPFFLTPFIFLHAPKHPSIHPVFLLPWVHLSFLSFLHPSVFLLHSLLPPLPSGLCSLSISFIQKLFLSCFLASIYLSFHLLL